MRRHLRNTLIGTAAATLSVGIISAAAWAKDLQSLHAPRSPEAVIKMFDTNGDKRIARAEIRFKSIEVFDRFDTNKNGFLDRSEVPGLPASVFKASDKNGDGKLSPFEYSQGEFLKFNILDINKDEFVTADEITAFRNRTKPK
jgi:hypothetical protein